MSGKIKTLGVVMMTAILVVTGCAGPHQGAQVRKLEQPSPSRVNQDPDSLRGPREIKSHQVPARDPNYHDSKKDVARFGRTLAIVSGALVVALVLVLAL